MYRARKVYTLSDLPMAREVRIGTYVCLAVLADLVYHLSSLLASLSWRVEAVAYRVSPFPVEPEAAPTEVRPLADFRAVAWEGDFFSDADTSVSLHLDPTTDTVVSPALDDRPILTTLADCRAAFCETAVPSPVPSALAPVATLEDCRDAFMRCERCESSAETEFHSESLCNDCAAALAKEDTDEYSNPFAITYTVYQRVGNRWTPVGSFEELPDDVSRKEGLRSFLRSQGIAPTEATLRRYSARRPDWKPEKRKSRAAVAV